jgi:hypothetical protein
MLGEYNEGLFGIYQIHEEVIFDNVLLFQFVYYGIEMINFYSLSLNLHSF